MATRRSQEAEQAYQRRMAKRVCGHCGEPAREMLSWGGQRIAICGECLDRLRQPGYHCPAARDLRPCDYCMLQSPVEARAIEGEIVEVPGVLVVAQTPPVSNRTPLARILTTLVGLWRR